MRPLSRPHRWPISLRAVLVAVQISGLILPGQAGAPAWWQTRGVLIPQAQPDDYAAANVGQLKTLAQKAAAEMDAAWPGFGAGKTIHDLLATWTAVPAPGVTRDDYAAVNAGQLKTVARPFYDRLAQLGHRAPNSYPWTGSTAPKDDFAVVNIGQVKTMFAFTIPAEALSGALQQVTSVGTALTDYATFKSSGAYLNAVLAAWQALNSQSSYLDSLLWALADEAYASDDTDAQDAIVGLIGQLHGVTSQMPDMPGIHLEAQQRAVYDSWSVSESANYGTSQIESIDLAETWIMDFTGAPQLRSQTFSTAMGRWGQLVLGYPEDPPPPLPPIPWRNLHTLGVQTAAKFVSMPTFVAELGSTETGQHIGVQMGRFRLRADAPVPDTFTQSYVIVRKSGIYTDTEAVRLANTFSINTFSLNVDAGIFNISGFPPPDVVALNGPPPAVGTATLTIPGGGEVSDVIEIPIPLPEQGETAPLNGVLMKEVSLVPVLFEVSEWEPMVVKPPAPRIQIDASANKDIDYTLVFVGDGDSFTLEAKVKINISSSLPSSVTDPIAQTWEAKILQNVTANPVPDQTDYEHSTTVVNVSPVPGMDAPPATGFDGKIFPGDQTMVTLEHEDAPGNYFSLWEGARTGQNRALNYKRDVTFITWLYVENSQSGERIFLRWIRWRAAWNVAIQRTATILSVNATQYVFEEIDRGDGKGPVEPSFQQISKTRTTTPR